jgi:peroxiredoxin
MKLKEKLANLAAEMQFKLPEEVKAVMNQAGINLVNSGILEQSLREGDRLPDFILPNVFGKLINIQELLKSGPVVISFYRGGWCPYCNLELRALQQVIPQIQTYGGNLVAISPETPDHSLSTVEKNELSFEVLSDVGNQVARQFGLVYTLPEELRPIYHEFGINLLDFNGDETFELPIPATYIIQSDGMIIYSFVNPDYTQRQEPEEIVMMLKNLKLTI